MASLLVLIIQLWLFTGVVLVLHRLAPRIGLAPLLFYISGIIAILNFAELMALFIEPFPGIIIRTGAHVFVPILLMTILVLYIANGTSPAQLVLYALTGVNILVITVLAFLFIYMLLNNPSTPTTGLLIETNLINLQFLRGVIASTVTFFLNMFLITIIYQGMRNVLPMVPMWVAIATALIVALWTDSVLFNLLANLGTPNFQLWLPGDVLAKSISGLLIAPMATYYLVSIAPKSSTFRGNEKRPTFDMLFGVQGGVKQSLKLLQQQMHEQEMALTSARERVTLLQDMVRDASHDLKTPIASLLLKIQLLERVPNEEARARYLSELKQQSYQLSAMIDDLFTMSRLDSNRLSETQIVNLTEMGNAVFEMYRPLAEENKIELAFERSDMPIWYEGLADELERIFLNLLGNAIRYTRKGKVTLALEENKQEVIIAVRDTGIGIHHDDIPKIFTRFFRAKTASEHGIRGTGLGLPIVKTIVDLHRGAIRVDSVVNEGTTFTVSLPKASASS
jgi:signal transduction histidine kinase